MIALAAAAVTGIARDTRRDGSGALSAAPPLGIGRLIVIVGTGAEAEAVATGMLTV